MGPPVSMTSTLLTKVGSLTVGTMQWAEILTSMLPTPRAGTTLTPVGPDQLYLFGGSGHYTTYYNDILIFDLSKRLLSILEK